jgi:Tol biopolymer transport system component
LLQLSADLSEVEREVRLDMPAGCALAGLHPSPDREALLAELLCPSGPVAVWVGMEDGTTARLVADDTVDSHFLAWAADSGSTYLRVDSLANPHIVRVDVDSRRAAQTPIDAYTYDLAAAPDGQHVLFSFSHGMGLGSEMWLAETNGRNARILLSDAEAILAFARWSPDGKHIAFIKIPDSQTPYAPGELWLMEADGSNAHKLADADAGHGYAPAWAPAGRRLAFVLRSNPEDERADQSLEVLVSNLAIVDAASGERTQITDFASGRVETPAWSPDGNTLEFPYVLDGRMEVLIADLGGGTVASILAQPVCCPVWMRK